MSDAAREDRPDYEAIAERLGVDANDPAIQADLQQLAGDPNLPPPSVAKPPRRGRPGRIAGKATPAKPPMTTAATIGFFMAIFVPFAGFLMGLALTAARDRHGHWVVVTSIAVTLLAAVALLDSL